MSGADSVNKKPASAKPVVEPVGSFAWVASLKAICRKQTGLGLSAIERSVLVFCIERTARYNNASDTISVREIADGAYDSRGHLVIAPAGVSKSTAHRAITSLTQKGFLQATTSHGRRTHIRLNPALWEDHMGLKTPKMKSIAATDSKLKVAKTRQSVPHRDTLVGQGVPRCRRPDGKSSTYDPALLYSNDLSNDPVSTQAETDVSALQVLQEKTEQAKNRSLAKRRARQSGSLRVKPNIEAFWLESGGPVCPPPSDVAFKVFKGLLPKITEEQVRSMMPIAIQHWTELVRCSFSGRPPRLCETPSLEAFCKYLRYLANGYQVYVARYRSDKTKRDVELMEANKRAEQERARADRLANEMDRLKRERLLQPAAAPAVAKPRFKIRDRDDVALDRAGPTPVFNERESDDE